MIIGDGILSIPVLATGWILSAGLLCWTLRKSAFRQLTRAAIFAAVFFLASLVRLSVGPWSVHFALLGVMGLTLGRQAFPVIFACLGLQSLLFPFGGLAVLGVNAFTLGLPALAAGLLFGRPAARRGRIGDAAAFLAGFLATGASALLICGSFALSDALAGARLPTLLGTGFLLAVLEGLITLFGARFLRRAAPNMLAFPPVERPESDPA